MVMSVMEERVDGPPGEDAFRSGVAPIKRAPLGRGDARDRCLNRAMRLIDPAVAASFSPAQRRAIRTMLDLRRDRRLMLDLRGGFDLAGRRYFFSVMGGHERRSGARRHASPVSGLLRRALPSLAIGAILLLGAFALAAGLRG